MAIEIQDRVAALISHLMNKMPTRKITDDLQEFSQINNKQAEGGVVSVLVGSGRSDGQPKYGTTGRDKFVLLLVCQQKIKKPSGKAVQDAELQFLSDIKNALAAADAPQDMSGAFVKNWLMSAQQDTQRAEIAINIEMGEY